MRLSLKLHPDSRCKALTRLEVEVSRPTASTLQLDYRLAGSIEALRIPSPTAAKRADGLWRRTCFEAFTGSGIGPYHEFNFAPSRQWAAYDFHAYREGMRAFAIPPPLIEVGICAERLDLRATIELPQDSTSLGLAAVIEEKSGTVSYWALAHPPGPPDFHHADCFAAKLPAARPA